MSALAAPSYPRTLRKLGGYSGAQRRFTKERSDRETIPVIVFTYIESSARPLSTQVMKSAYELVGHDLGDRPIGEQVFQVNLQYALGEYVIVDGEWCTWREDNVLGVVVKREPWSLMGAGRTLHDAIDNFRAEAASHAVGMQHDRFDEVTEEAWRMRDFVMRYLPEDG